MEVNIPCPKCKREFPRKIRDIKDGKKIRCPHCKSTITLKVEGNDLTKPDKELKKLQKKLQNINLDIKFKL